MWKEAGIFGIFLVSIYVLFRDHAAKQRMLEEENRALEEIQDLEYQGTASEEEDYDEEEEDLELAQRNANNNNNNDDDNHWAQWENQMLQEQERLMNYNNNVILGDEAFDQRFDQMTPEELEDLRNRINPRPDTPTSTSRNRNREVGAKKAKSLEKRDRIRAYHEYVRQVSMAEKLAQREYEESHRDLIEEDRRRRAEKEAEIEQLRKQRQSAKREQEEQERQARTNRRQELESELQSSGKVQLTEYDLEIVQGMSNVLVVGEIGNQWLVRADNPHYLFTISKALDSHGRVSLEELATKL